MSIVILLGFGPLAALADEPKIETKRPEVEKKTFDPRKPPVGLEPGEAGVTVCDFSCEPEFDIHGDPVAKKSEEDCSVTITVSVASVMLDLNITEWLPESAPAQLKGHEEGHADICEKAYQDAEKAAKEAAKQFGKKTFTGKGKNCEAAMKNAQDQAIKEFCDDYGAMSRTVAQRVSTIYDQLTDHGKNKEPEPKKAVERAFEKDKQNEKEKSERKR